MINHSYEFNTWMDEMFEILNYVRNPSRKRKFVFLFILLSWDYNTSIISWLWIGNVEVCVSIQGAVWYVARWDNHGWVEGTANPIFGLWAHTVKHGKDMGHYLDYVGIDNLVSGLLMMLYNVYTCICCTMCMCVSVV